MSQTLIVRLNRVHQRPEALDERFYALVDELQAALPDLPKFLYIRVCRWLKKLSVPAIVANLAWRKNRNEYAELLMHAIAHRDFSEPFHRLPADGTLPTLAPYLRLRISKEQRASSCSFSTRRRQQQEEHWKRRPRSASASARSFETASPSPHHMPEYLTKSWDTHAGPAAIALATAVADTQRLQPTSLHHTPGVRPLQERSNETVSPPQPCCCIGGGGRPGPA
ncbi:unnamed protein product [Phaeothamnion confervicola]